jgi:hypothetical protein
MTEAWTARSLTPAAAELPLLTETGDNLLIESGSTLLVENGSGGGMGELWFTRAKE